MEKSDIEKIKHEASKVNEFRHQFWMEHKLLQRGFIAAFPPEKFQEDPDWHELWRTICDMLDSTEGENIRRFHGDRMKKFQRENRDGRGLYKKNKLCQVCHMPLTGRQEKYCSEGCRNKAKSRRFRKKNPEANEKANLKYLKEIYPDDT